MRFLKHCQISTAPMPPKDPSIPLTFDELWFDGSLDDSVIHQFVLKLNWHLAFKIPPHNEQHLFMFYVQMFKLCLLFMHVGLFQTIYEVGK
jgi:hypothetical protein